MFKRVRLQFRVFQGRWWRIVGISGLAISSLSFASERHVTVLPLSHAVPEQIVPVVKNLLSKDSSASGYNNQLILNVLPAELKQVEILLKQIDKPARLLLISVRTSQTDSSIAKGASIEGADGKMQAGEGRRRSKGTVRNSHRNNKGASHLMVQATEGLPAYIASGQERLVRSWKSDDEDHKGEIVREYKSADRGFYVVPRITGKNQVALEIQQTNDNFNSHTIQKRHIITTVSGTLGEWIRLGSMGLDSYGDSLNMGTLSSSADSSADASSDMIEIRIEEI